MGVPNTEAGVQAKTSSGAPTRIAQTMATIDDAMPVHTLGASYSPGMVGDVGRKINDTFFRYNLMEQFNSSMPVGATEAAMNGADPTFAD